MADVLEPATVRSFTSSPRLLTNSLGLLQLVTLPLELRTLIYESCTPATLATLALVATFLQHEAERALYTKIAVRFDENQLEKSRLCLETLVACPRKAAFVQAFQAGLGRGPWGTARADFAQAVLHAMPRLINVVDLRIQLNQSTGESHMRWIESFEYAFR